MNSRYRPEIDGLRAISVLSVLAFHIQIPIFKSGFVGVDIFFVISGYLITQVLESEFRRDNHISLIGFWARRVRRLAPAFLLVLISVLAIGQIALTRVSGEVGLLDRAALSTLLFSANLFALSQSGDYFADWAQTNPLLHMWSLSVEEQFYIFWPLLLTFALVRGGRGRLRSIITVLAFASFSLSCFLTHSDSSAAFFLMPTRAWELMLGSLLAVQEVKVSVTINQRRRVWIVGWFGVLLIIYSVFFLDEKLPFPGPAASFPVLGSYFLIWSGHSNSRGGLIGPSNFLTCRPLVYCGKLSYPLYLWHWPILVLMRSQRLFEDSKLLDAFGLAISFVLAIATYEYIEKKSWNILSKLTPKQTLSLGAFGTGVALCLALISGIWVRTGWGYSKAEAYMDRARNDMPGLECMFTTGLPTEKQENECYRSTGRPSVLLLGDSHANHWNPALREAAQRLNLNLGVLTMNACRPLLGPIGTAECIAFNWRNFNQLARWKETKHLRGLIVSARWPEGMGRFPPSIADRRNWEPGVFFDSRAQTAEEALKYFSEQLRQIFDITSRLDIRVLIILTSPVQKFSAIHCLLRLGAEQCYVDEEEFAEYSGPADDVIIKVSAEYPGVRMLEPRGFMCEGRICPVIQDKVVIYTDDDHISKSYSKLHSGEFDESLRWLTQTR
ncbi:acyltransferase family protein [Methylolobus aquaticus]